MNYDPAARQFNSVRTSNVTTLHWGFAIEYSTLYLTERFVPIPKTGGLRLHSAIRS
ncbi:hypothetical protein LJR296_006895 [Cupriavidus necator]|uniref:hypothetical protein n=1 Tax=Cupriavidus necator TaxID=106590 RepID=UPI003ECE41FD